MPPVTTTCQEWTGALNSKGYGCRSIGGRVWLAHRVAYAAEYGPIPDGLHVHHRCGNRRCVNVAHLALATALDHNRSHLLSISASQLIERELAQGSRTLRELVTAAALYGISPGAVSTALSRAPTVRRVARGQYEKAA